MRTRRWTLVVVVLLLMGIITAGVVWTLSRKSADTLLARAEVALRADQIDKALRYTQEYIDRNPSDWKGPFEQARVLMHAGRFQAARDQVQVAASLDGPDGPIALLLARSWSLPARNQLRTATDANAATLRDVLDQLARADEILSASADRVETPSPDVREALGEIHFDQALACGRLAQQLGQKAALARATRDESGAKKLDEQAHAAEKRAEEHFALGRDFLLNVVREDPARVSAGRLLVRLCVAGEDRETLARLEELLSQPGHPAAEAEVAMWTHRMDGLDPANPADRGQLQRAARAMDEILAGRPKMHRARLLRARLAVRLGNIETARAHSNTLLKHTPNDREGRLLRAQLLRLEGKLSEAERELFSLRAQYGNWLAAQMMYAYAAAEAGYPDLAREALRAATRIDPSYPEARRRLARYLLREGFYKEAFDEARIFHRVAPDDPEAIRLLAATAARARFTDRAREALDQAQQRWPDRADVLIAVAEGFGEIGDSEQARRIARRVAQVTPDTSSARLAVARALTLTGRLVEAQTMLENELRDRPSQPEVLFELARAYAANGRVLDSLEMYRRAVKASPHRGEYVLALAQALLDQGELDESARVLDMLPPDHSAASLLRLQIQLRRGLPMETDELVKQVEEGRRQGLPLALVHLNNGQPAKCVEICRIELKKRPDDLNNRSLLGQALLSMGQVDQCIEEWKKVLQLGPERLTVYLKLGEVLARTKDIDQVARELSQVPGSVENLVHMTAAALFARDGKHARAAARYGRVTANDKAPDYLRGRAGLLRARSLAAAGMGGEALRELDRIEQIPVWRAQAILARAQLLYLARQRSAGAAQLKRVLDEAAENEDVESLRRLVQIALAVRETGIALQGAEQTVRITPGDPRAHLQLARVHLAGGDLAEVESACRAAIAAQPGSIRAQLALVEVLDLQARRADALGVLEGMEKQGRANQTAALLQQAALLRRWGLIEPAMQRYARLDELGYGQSPRLQLALGRMFYLLGRPERARDKLTRIPQYAPQHVRARQILAEMAETPEEKLAALAKLARSNPDEPAIAMQRMGVLIRSSRNDEAAAAFRTLMSSPDSDAVTNSAALVAVRAMLQNGQFSQAGETCMQMARQTRQPGWRYLAVLLTMDEKPQLAAQLLEQVDTPGELDVLEGLTMAGMSGDADRAQRWWDRLEALRAREEPDPNSYTRIAVLAAMIGAPSRGGELADGLGARKTYWQWAAEELAGAVRNGSADSVEVGRLLRAELANALGVPEAAQKWAMDVLKDRPRSQWAAALVLNSAAGDEVRRKAADTVRPADAPIAVQMRASLLARQRKFAEASTLYGQLAGTFPKRVDLRMLHAASVEKAGELERALALYESIWDDLSVPMAANNAAYLIAVRHGGDAGRLARAWKLAQTAIRAHPRSPGCHDTTGWLAYLRGEYPLARRHLLEAVRRAPRTPEIHYHLGMAERKGGSQTLGEYHLRAAVEAGRSMKQRGEPLSSETLRVLALAEKALKK